MPTYRSPRTDPPHLGELIHYVGGATKADNTGVEYPGLVCDFVTGMLTFYATVLRPRSVLSIILGPDDYDPSPEPAAYTWHFDHRPRARTNTCIDCARVYPVATRRKNGRCPECERREAVARTQRSRAKRDAREQGVGQA